MNIKRVQSELNARGFGPLDVDGEVGPKTTQAVKEFQTANKITPDGAVGPATLAALFPPPKKTELSNKLNLRAMQIAQSKEGVREATGANDGTEVEKYLKSVGLGKGFSWCMAFVYWCYEQAAQQLKVKNPLVKTGGCMKQWNETTCKKSKAPQIGSIFIMDLGGGAGHTGIVTAVRGDVVDTIEGNTNTNGSANGDGVYKRSRPVARIKGFINC